MLWGPKASAQVTVTKLRIKNPESLSEEAAARIAAACPHLHALAFESTSQSMDGALPSLEI